MISSEIGSSQSEDIPSVLTPNSIPSAPRYWVRSQVGRVLAGRYRLEAEIGAGAMGKVYQAFDLKRRRRYAVKLVRPEADRSLQVNRRFQNEAHVAAQLFHHHIVTVYEFNQDSDGTKFLVLELLDGIDLQEHLTLYGRLLPRHAVEVLRSVGSALQYAHDLGIIHRDIKPENIFLHRQRSRLGEITETVKVLDFGLARLLRDFGDPSVASTSDEAVRLTQGLAVGTPAYLAPEAIKGCSLLDGRADQWSLAIVAYQILSGRLPFEQSNSFELCKLICNEDPIPLKKLRPDLPDPIYHAIETALKKNPEERFPKISQFVRLLEPLPAALWVRRSQPFYTTLQPAASQQGRPQAGVNDEGCDTLGQVQPGLGTAPVDLAFAIDSSQARTQSEAPPEDSPFTKQTIQYSPDELRVLAQGSLPELPNVPSPIDHEGPTEPYPRGASEPAVSASAPPALGQPKADGRELLRRPATSAQTPALPRRGSVSLLGIGSGSALFCLGLLLALAIIGWHPTRAHLKNVASSPEPQGARPERPTGREDGRLGGQGAQ